MPMKLLLVNQLLVNRVAKIEIQIKLFLENVEKFHNCLKIPFFGLKIRLLFTDLFRIRFRIRIRIRIQNVYFGSGSDPDPAKVSDPYGSGSGSGSATLLLSNVVVVQRSW